MASGVRRYDVVIIGGGVTGLLACYKLSSLGMKVLLLEREPALASGPSTRNEGWLHRGTYHAASINDREAAMQVARRCIYGHEQIRTLAPEAVEGVEQKSFALVRDRDRVDDILSRWTEAGVRYRPCSNKELSSLFPNADLSRVSVAFDVADISINTRLLYRRLYFCALRNGAEIQMSASLSNFEGMSASLSTAQHARCQIEAGVFVHTSGFGARSFFRALFSVELPIRYWKSHLVIAARLGTPGLFYLDAHEAAMMHHGEHTIVGLNEDAVLCDEPTYDVLPSKAANLHMALNRLVPGWSSSGHLDIACTKVDLAPSGAARSLNVAIQEAMAGHLCVLPGKMTEAPFATDVLTKMLHERLDTAPIAPRPCDHFRVEPSDARNAA